MKNSFQLMVLRCVELFQIPIEMGSGLRDTIKAIIPYSLLSNDLLYGSDAGNGMRNSINPGLLDLDPAPHFDMIIVDEAHHIRHDNTQAYAVVKHLCEHADSVIFLTATPLQTSDQDLYTLLNVLRPDVILDQETFIMMGKPNPYINQAVQVIRTQAENWADTATQLLKKVEQTQWGRHIIAPNPIYQSVIAQLTQRVIREERVRIISNVEVFTVFQHHKQNTQTRYPGFLYPAFVYYRKWLRSKNS